MTRHQLTSGLLVVSAGAFLAFQFASRTHAQSNQTSTATGWSTSRATVLIRYGVKDTATRIWHGWVEASQGGRVVAVEPYHFQPGDTMGQSDGGVPEFNFTTRAWTPNVAQIDLSPVLPGPRPVFPSGILVHVDGGASSRIHIVAAPPGGQDDFGFTLADLANGKQLAFENGNVEVELAGAPAALSDGSADADYPSVAPSREGRVAVAWQEFTGERDRLVLREWDGKAWSATAKIENEQTADMLRPAAAYDGAGDLHLVWSAQVNGNFDLYEQCRSGSAWKAIERLTTTPGADFNPKLFSDTAGRIWLAWQSFRDGQSDIYLRSFENGAWTPEVRVSPSSANDWEPSIAGSSDGTIWVGWDTYDQGNYDIRVRSFRDGKLGSVVPITKSPRFEAHASLACDAQGRLWIAFDEAEANWGKDYGYLVKTSGNPLYQSRKLRVVRLTGERIEEPASGIDKAFPLYLPRFLQNPQITVAPDGRVAIAALQLVKSNSVIEVWGANGVWENVLFTLGPNGFERHQVLPSSAGANDQRVAVAAGSDGRIWAAWGADSRDYLVARPRTQQVFAAVVPVPAGAGEIPMRPFVEAPELSLPSHLREKADLQTVRDYRIDAGPSPLKIMRGDLHRHTSLSTDGVGDGSLWDFYRYALDAASLDFSTVTDHQGGITSYNWWKTQKSSDLFQTPGRLTTLYAYERSVVYPNGHRNLVFTRRGVPILPIDPAEMTGPKQAGTKRSSDELLPYLRKFGGLAFRHTTATDQGTDWADHNNELEPMVEVYQGHRLVYEHEGGPKAPTADKLYAQRSGYQPAGYIWDALAKGYRLGFEAASDHCSTHISYSCILVSGNSREDLLDAMRKRHSYGATDNIVLDVRARANGKQYIQGDDFETSGSYVLSVHIIATAPIKRIDVIHNESYAYNVMSPTGKDVQFTYDDAHPAPGENRYYVRIEQEDGNMAWSSPLWIRRSN